MTRAEAERIVTRRILLGLMNRLPPDKIAASVLDEIDSEIVSLAHLDRELPVVEWVPELPVGWAR